jgi:hypothetical protein
MDFPWVHRALLDQCFPDVPEKGEPFGKYELERFVLTHLPRFDVPLTTKQLVDALKERYPQLLSKPKSLILQIAFSMLYDDVFRSIRGQAMYLYAEGINSGGYTIARGNGCLQWIQNPESMAPIFNEHALLDADGVKLVEDEWKVIEEILAMDLDGAVDSSDKHTTL